MTTTRARSNLGPSITGVTVGALIASLALSAWIDGARGIVAGSAGALVALLVQGLSGWLVLRRWRDSDAAFLGAFAGAMAVRVGGGTLLVLIALASRRLAPLPFLAAFGVVYVVLEVVADVLYVRMERQKSDKDARC
ncbi:MAG: hypothetical protein IPH13_06660 [Planctomycetes bacterium]|nr:hypothetical protein [Planctomycetota bacterium]MCC7172081.1 hypothetical protein [Planctomycetota bacterium]